MRMVATADCLANAVAPCLIMSTTYYVLNGDMDVVDTPIHMYLCAEVCSHPQLAHIHACNSRSPSSPSRADALELMKLR